MHTLNSTDYLGKEKTFKEFDANSSEPKVSLNKRGLYFTAAIVFILYLIFSSYFSSQTIVPSRKTTVDLAYSKSFEIPSPEVRYGIIVDAGSTQTRLYIYQWQGPSNASVSPHVQPYLDLVTGRPAKFIKDGGIADLVLEEEEEGITSSKRRARIQKFFKHLISYAKYQLPDYESQQKNTQIHVMATAGVRVLGFDRQAKLVEAVREFLGDSNNSPFLFEPNFGVLVLPGEFEGAFDWLTVNYLAGTLKKESIIDSLVSIDFGGSSLELTFEPEEEDPIMEGAFPLRVNGTDRILYTQSYLRFGRNQALQRYRQGLIASRESSSMEDVTKIRVDDPCFDVGFEEDQEFAEYSGKLFRFIGTGDYMLCQILTRELLRENKFCAVEPCAINGKYQPPLPLGRPIIAIDGFAKLAEVLNCPSFSPLTCIELNAQTSCQSSAKLQTSSHHHHRHSLYQTRCFLAAYGTNILRHGFKLDPNWPIRFADEDWDGNSYGWTLGAMIYVLEIESFNKGDCGVSLLSH